ncbi:hypothetical protein EYZ11_001082 [Aspergillus tanneri]|uniref:Uncharacterized protein n=1 Tax=Aspergillus tanneri TaxID=1220188 RepID=A0A4S3JVH8_9EURO|nr:hypothetical protein EYZ11_001082 [Aspergillus tanneri]
MASRRSMFFYWRVLSWETLKNWRVGPATFSYCPNREKAGALLASWLDSIDETIRTLVQHMSTLQASRSSAVWMLEIPTNSDLEDMESIFYASPSTVRSGNNLAVSRSSYKGTGRPYGQYPLSLKVRICHSSPLKDKKCPCRLDLLKICLLVFLKYFNFTLPIFTEFRWKEAINAYYTDGAYNPGWHAWTRDA